VATSLDPGLYYGRVAGVASLCIIVLMLITSIAVLIHFGKTRGQDGSTVWQTRVAPALATLGLGAIVYLALKNANAFMASTTSLSIIFITGIVGLFATGVGLGLYLKARRPEVYGRIGRQSVNG